MPNIVKITPVKIVNNVKESMTKIGVKNAKQLADLTGMNERTAYRLWNDPTMFPSATSMEQMMSTFEISVSDILKPIKRSTF